jgi:hypothetical protein
MATGYSIVSAFYASTADEFQKMTEDTLSYFVSGRLKVVIDDGKEEE